MDNLEIWENIFKSQEWGKYPDNSLIRFIARHFYSIPLAERGSIKILELGSGTGANLWYMAREGFQVYAIEGSETATKISIDRLCNEGLKAQIGKIECGNYSRIDYADCTFDAVVDVESLYCNSMKNARSIVAEVSRVLKPGGHFYSQTFADGTWGLNGPEIDYHAVVPQEGPMAGKGLGRYTTRADIDDLYQTADLKVISVEKVTRTLSNGETSLIEWIIDAGKTK